MHLEDGMLTRNISLKVLLLFVLLLVPFLFSGLASSQATHVEDVCINERHLTINNAVLVAGDFHYFDVTLSLEAEKICIIAYAGDFLPECEDRSVANYYRWEYNHGVWKDVSGHDSSYLLPSKCVKENDTYSFYLGIDQKANPGHWTIKILVDDTEVSSTSSIVIIAGFNVFLSAIIGVFEPSVEDKRFLVDREIICPDRKRLLAESGKDIDTIVDKMLKSHNPYTQCEDLPDETLDSFLVNDKSPLNDELAQSTVSTYHRSKLKQEQHTAASSLIFNKKLGGGNGFWNTTFDGHEKIFAILFSFILLSVVFIPLITGSSDDDEIPADITIINVQSYPMVGGEWTVMFTTVGRGNLTITAVDGTTWSNNDTSCDLRFLELRCGNETLDYEWVNNSVFIENYSSSEIGYKICRVLTPGNHTLQFRFGDDVAYAYNDASTWWDPNWFRRAQIYLNTSSGSTPTGYQVLLNITYDANMNNNFSDLRFINYSDNTTEFDYWIQNKSDGNWANVWVGLGKSVTTTNTTHAWVYYGNAGANSNSDKNTTMNFFETGSLLMDDTIDQGIVETVNLYKNYNNPAVVAYIATRGGGQSIDIRVRNVGSNSFEIFEEEPDDQNHNDETANWIAADSGSYIGLDGQLRIEAGTHSTSSNHTEGSAFGGDIVNFTNNFSSIPSILATLNTYNNGAFMSTHTHGNTTAGFIVQQEVGGSGSSVSTETIGWIAFSRVNGTNDGVSYNISYYPQDGDSDGVDDSAESILYSFSGNPCLVVQGATAADTNGYWARGAGTFNSNSADFYAEEDQVGDNERNHGDEGFGWAAFYPMGNITVRKYSAQEPTYWIGSEEVNDKPGISNPNPADGSTNIDPVPTLSVYCSHPNSYIMNLTWYENTTGSWVNVSQNTSISNGTYYYPFTNATEYDRTYYWRVNLSDGYGNYDNKTYYFTTRLPSSSVDSIVPYVQASSPLNITATADNNIDNVALWYRYSTDNSSKSWGTIGEVRKLTSVDDSWTTLNFWNNYTNPVIVAVNNLASSANNEVVVRMSNVTGTSCDVRLQNPDGDLVTSADVHVIVMEEGAYNLSDGKKVEAYKYEESKTFENGNWGVGTQQTYSNSYTNPVVLGQVMSQNDSDWSVFHCDDGGDRANPPTNTDLYTCKHVGKDADTTRNPEIVGYIVIEQGSGSVNSINYRCALGADSVAGVDDSPPYTYALGGTYAVGVATKAAEDGGDGGWGVLYGASPITTSIALAVDEDTTDGSNRAHTEEQVAYWVFAQECNITNDEGSGWTKWNDVSNPDTNSPWSWDFDFPNSTGYYEFYSIGNKSGSTDETAPSSADAICYLNTSLNNAPTQSGEVPSNGSMEVNLTPQLSVTVDDSEDNMINATWHSNSSGSWVQFGSNLSIDPSSGSVTIRQTNSNFSNYETTYWWSVNTSDGYGWGNETYHFTTAPINTSVDAISPYTITSLPYNITATGNSNLDNVTLFYRWSKNNWTANWTTLTYDDFEAGFGNYSDGGGDCSLYTGGTYAHQGSNAADIQDRSGDASSFYYTTGMDVDAPGYSSIKVDFWFYSVGLDNGHDFFVEYWNGSTWQNAATYVQGTDFVNGQFYHEFVWINETSYIFPTDMQIKFRCDATNNNDDVYIDEVYVNATPTSTNWTAWNNANNPDTSYSWSWDFDFPNSTGYYEFYSIGNKSGSTDETAPATADAICYYDSSLNNAPSIDLISPENGSTGVSLQPSCQIWAKDLDGGILDVYWYENTTGSWVLRNTNSSVSANSIVSYNFTQFNSYYTTFWWRVAVNDSIENTTATYYFTTEPINTSVDTITPYNVTDFPLVITATGNSDLDNVTLYCRWSENNWTGDIWTTLTYDDFEAGFGNYSDGGGDCSLYTGGTYAHQGSNAADIQDNSGDASSFYHTTGIDVDTADYTLIKVDFWFYSVGLANGEDFWVQYYDGSSWNIVADFDAGTDFVNDQFYHKIVWINETDYTFPSNMQIKFTCDASNPVDDVYIDEIYVNATPTSTNWTVWNNANNPDTSYSWSWDFDYPEGTGYYEFYSIGKKSNSPDELPPAEKDAACYVPSIQPVINSYDIRNASGSKLNNATGLLDVNSEYQFQINITDENGWWDVNYINITAWYDNGNDSTYYNQTEGGNLNMFLQYENTTGNANFTLLWPDDEVQLILANCTETVIDWKTRIVNISFKPLGQVRWASSNDTWDGAQDTTNDPYSWNFNITVSDTDDLITWKRDEYGVYKFTSILPDQDWVDVIAAPGFNDSSNIVAITYSSNYDFNMTIYFEQNLTNTSHGDAIEIANNVYILESADTNDDITYDVLFAGIGKANAVDIFNDSGIFHSNNVSQTVNVQFNVYIPLGTYGGRYTARVATKIIQD